MKAALTFKKKRDHQTILRYRNFLYLKLKMDVYKTKLKLLDLIDLKHKVEAYLYMESNLAKGKIVVQIITNVKF